VLLASVLVCLFTGVFSGLQIYLAQLVSPDFHAYRNIETAFMDAGQVVGGSALFTWFGAMLIVNSFGCGLTGQVGAARLVYTMGRERVLPAKIFAYVDEKRSSPTYNILIIAALAYAGAMLLSFERAAELLNFGAFLTFMGVNLATLRQFCFMRRPGERRRLLVDAVLPGIGFLFCLVIGWNLPRPAQILGGIWLALGLLYLAIQTRGFRRQPVTMDFSEM